ncbi:MAG: hypothetical protein KDJ62_01325 [Rhodobiaceae bacterium]|nr:hypothetical protein [Rhodobiaceae bacterium]MCC0047899.1 hypothetical protein [Rhodobiaceae bacterium]
MAVGTVKLRNAAPGVSAPVHTSFPPSSSSTILSDTTDSERDGFNRLREAMGEVERLEQVGTEDSNQDDTGHGNDWPAYPPIHDETPDAQCAHASLEEELAASLAASTSGSPDNADPVQHLEQVCRAAVAPEEDCPPTEQSTPPRQNQHIDVLARQAGTHGSQYPVPLRRETLHRQHGSTSILSIIAWVALPAVVASPLLISGPGEPPARQAQTQVQAREEPAVRADRQLALAAISGRIQATGTPEGEAVPPPAASLEPAALQQPGQEADAPPRFPAPTPKTARLDAGHTVTRRDPVQVASAVNAVPALSSLPSQTRADLQSRLEGGECLSSAMPAVLGHVPVVAMRDMIRLLEGDCR